MTIITHTVKVQKSTGTFTNLEDALADYRGGLPQEFMDALVEHENTCIQEGVVTEPASYEFDADTQTLTVFKKTTDLNLLKQKWILNPLRATAKATSVKNGWIPISEEPKIVTKQYGEFFKENDVRMGRPDQEDLTTILTGTDRPSEPPTVS